MTSPHFHESGAPTMTRGSCVELLPGIVSGTMFMLAVVSSVFITGELVVTSPMVLSHRWRPIAYCLVSLSVKLSAVAL